jgi:hypothetical protein
MGDTYKEMLRGNRDADKILKELGVSGNAAYEPTHGESLTSTYVYSIDDNRIGAEEIHRETEESRDRYELAATMLKLLADLYIADPISIALLLTRINHPSISNRELALMVGMKKTVVGRRLKSLAEKHPALDRALYSYSSTQAIGQRDRRKREGKG